MHSKSKLTKKTSDGISKTNNERLEQAAKRRKARELETQRFIDQDLQKYMDEIADQQPDEFTPSARDVIYDNAVSDYEEVSDEFKKEEMRGKLCLFSLFVNFYATAVEGKHISTVFYDKNGEM